MQQSYRRSGAELRGSVGSEAEIREMLSATGFLEEQQQYESHQQQHYQEHHHPQHHHQQQQQQQRDFPVCCLHPGCDAQFKRRADLQRHYRHRHTPDSVKESFSCDYPRCSRYRDPFYRLDHFRDHLRDFHKEDIEKRGSETNNARPVSGSWWRCRRCLKRVYDLDACPRCKTKTPGSQTKRKDAASHVSRQR
ncbi:hypothetical protein CDD80_3349 [Ophiocordyceps camponoti-rufipedis]|uniref:C2H2-type domain-containing protein n=1 Tax=Ophiocordyceps camponoti-rufipedis TaxID=2004952 RepID=A0A2C5ZJ56_9HYPO|nr:hypothetical protein CDD80_3349 [Ophiocordyceps camponoti-rufipedis]